MRAENGLRLGTGSKVPIHFYKQSRNVYGDDERCAQTVGGIVLIVKKSEILKIGSGNASEIVPTIAAGLPRAEKTS